MLRQVEGLRDVIEQAGEWVYAWCAGRCNSAKRYVERACGGAPRAVEGWWCAECRALAAAANAAAAAEADEVAAAQERGERLLVVRDCPGCGVATEKMYGCDHMECVCGMHWCFGCGEMGADNAGAVYKHMSEVHRTWGVGWDDGYGYDEEYYDSDEDEEED